MNNNNNLITEVKQEANIQNVEEISLEEAKKIVKLLEEGKISGKHLEALTESSSNFVKSITDLVEALPRLVETVGSVDKQALEKIDHLNQTTNTLIQLAKNSKSDGARIKIAELIVQVAQEYNEAVIAINCNNNSTLKQITIILGTILAFISTLIFGREEI